MARTRRQVTLQQQESGVPASPPQSLPTATRATRAKRTTTRNNTTAAPADPEPSTRGGPGVRGGRIGRAKKVERRRVQPPATTNDDAPESSATDVDRPEASDSLPQKEVTVQSTPTTRRLLENHDETEDVVETNGGSSGETQSPIGVSAHPAQIQDMTAHPVQVQDITANLVQVQDVTAYPVQGSTIPQERHESATSQIFKDILKSSPQSSGPSPGRSTPKAVAPITPLHSTFVPSSGTLSTPRVSPSSSSPFIKPVPQGPPRISPSPSSPLIKSVPQAPPKVSFSPSSPLITPLPQAPSLASPTPVYYMPSNPEHSHSLITIRMDYFQGSKDPVRPSQPAAFAVPSDLVAPFCRYIEARAKSGSDLSKLTTDHPAVNAIVYGTARYRPQLPSWQSQESAKPPGSTLREAFIRRAQRKRGFREMEEEAATLNAENVKLKADAAGESTESPPKRTKIVPDPWTADGQLVLGRTKEIEVDQYGIAVNAWDEPNLRWNDTEARKKAQLEEAQRVANSVGESPYIAEEIPDTDGPGLGGLSAETQDQVEPEQVPETPRARGWGLAKFLPSARSVTKFIPFSSRRTTSTQPPQPQQLAQTDPHITAVSSQPQSEPDVADTVAGAGHRRHQSTSNQQKLLTKQQSEEEKRIKKMRAQLRREAEALEKQRKDLEIAKKDLAEQQMAADVAQTPGKKRKRIPSPDVIPLPASGGYGMVDEYFIVDSSSDEEDAVAQETPTKERPLKKARTSAPSDATIGSPFKARPYTGTLFAHPDALGSRQDDNAFVESNKPNASPASDTTPPPGPTLIFKVPSPGSSDSDEDDDDEQEKIHKPIQSASSSSLPPPKSILRNSNSNQSQSRPTANSPSSSKTLAPPPRPNPSHATLPAPIVITPSDALEKAREKALRHQPKQPSTLRESSRLSSSTVNSDLGDEENVEEYNPAHPAIITAPSKAPVFGQPAPSAGPTFSQPVIGSTPSTGFQQPVTEVVNEQPYGQQDGPNTSGKQGEPSSDVSAPANDARLSRQSVALAEEQTKPFENSQEVTTNMSPKIKADMDRWWKEHGDSYVSDEGYEDFQQHLLAEEQELMDGPNGYTYQQPRNIISAALDRIGADGLADRGIQTDIEANWRPGDLERTKSDPANGMKVFFDRLVKNGDIDKDLADRVIAIGVPPSITEYLAGQEVMGPAAA